MRTIADSALKISLLQVVPGWEFEVVRDLRKGLGNLNIEPFAIFKALGAYDIVLLYSSPTFDPLLTRAGSIPGRLRSNEFLCYWSVPKPARGREEGGPKIAGVVSPDTPLLGLCLFKIRPSAQTAVKSLEEALFDFFEEGRDDPRPGKRKDNPHRVAIGTIGWNEIVVLVPGKRIGTLCTDLLKCSSLLYKKGAEYLPLVAKTFTILAVNFRDLGENPPLRGEEHAYQAALASKFREKLTKKMVPTFSVACRPAEMKSLHDAVYETFDKEPSVAWGRDDLVCQVPSMKWGELLAKVIIFRQRNRGKILNTTTSLNFGASGLLSPAQESAESQPPAVSLTRQQYDLLTKKIGPNAADRLASAIYTFNGYLQNPVVCDAFLDMAKYPAGLLARCLDGQLAEPELSVCTALIRYGAELRSYGAYGTIEEGVGLFSPFKGGIQRLLSAAELIPRILLKRVNAEWSGFIVAGWSEKFQHVDEVINIPLSHLWSPACWWGSFHEIGHVFEKQVPPELWREKEQAIETLLKRQASQQGPFRLYWRGLVGEVESEIFGLWVGFRGDYGSYIRLLADYLLRHEPRLKDLAQRAAAAQYYAFRCLAAKMFMERMLLDSEPNRDECLDTMPSEIEGLMALLPPEFQLLIPTRVFCERCRERVDDIWDFLLYLRKKYLPLLPHLRPQQDVESDKIVEHVMGGHVWDKEIPYPEGVICGLIDRAQRLENGRLPFSTKIATILSFAHAHARLLSSQ